MSYQYNKPAAGDQLNQSQVDLQDNFIELNTAFDVNHVGFNVTDQGKHDFIHFPSQTPSATIPPVTSSTEVGLYARGSNLYLRPPSSTIGDIANDRRIDLPLVGSTSAGSTNFEGLKIIWGSATISISPVWMTFADGGFTNACYKVIVCSSYNSTRRNFVQVDNSLTTKTQFFCRSYDDNGNANSSSINYVAFGY